MEKFLKYLNLENTPTLAHLDSKKRIREVNAVKFPGGHLVQWIILDDEENLENSLLDIFQFIRELRK